MIRVLDLFSGIGGFSLGLEMAGPEFETVAFCEIEEFPRKVLKKHWPEVPVYEDIRTLTAERLRADGIGPVDLVCGGFPCQPVSIAGLRKGNADSRWLWPYMHSVCRVVKPTWVLAENVPGLLQGDDVSGGLCTIVRDLAQIGYRVEWDCLPARAVGARHWRERVFITARLLADASRKGLEGIHEAGGGINLQSTAGDLRGVWLSEPDVDRVADGVPHRMDRLRCLGNSVVPQVAELIGRVIMRQETVDV